MSNKYHKVVSDWLVSLSAKMEAGKPVQPPAAPPPQNNYQAHPFELFVPYATEEFARTFIHLLKVSPETPDHLKNMISVWVDEYDQKLFEWLSNHYGPGVERVADVITKQVMTAQHMRAEQQAKQAVDSEITDLEAQFKNGEDDGSTA